MILVLYAEISEKNHMRLLDMTLPLPESANGRIKKYKRWQDAQRSVLGYLLLQTCLERKGFEYYKLTDIEYNLFGKPFFKSQEIHFNISHSGNIVVCAFTQKSEIGIDIEIKSKIEFNDFQDQLTDADWKRIENSSDMTHTFYEIWTQKEAIIKSQGKGLSISLKSFQVTNNSTRIGNEDLFVRCIDIHANYICHIAAPIDLVNSYVKIEHLDVDTL